MDLEQEMQTYTREVEKLLANDGEGKFVLIQGDHVIDTFSSYEDALKAGYKEFGVEKRFLVKQILGAEHIHSFTRDITSSCHT